MEPNQGSQSAIATTEIAEFARKRKVPPSCSRAGKSARSLNGRRDDEL